MSTDDSGESDPWTFLAESGLSREEELEKAIHRAMSRVSFAMRTALEYAPAEQKIEARIAGIVHSMQAGEVLEGVAQLYLAIKGRGPKIADLYRLQTATGGDWINVGMERELARLMKSRTS